MQNHSIRICFIINPAANGNRSFRNVQWIREQAAELWPDSEVIIAKPEDSLADLTKEKARNFDVIVACGGDGTISQIVNGLVKSGTVLGILPVGSGNDFVKSLGLPRNLPECMKILAQNHTTEIDLIRYEGDVEGWCANTMGLGIDGWANYYAHQMGWLKGQLRYFYGALKAIFTFKGSEMNIQTPEYADCDGYVMATACNGKWEGGNFFVAPEAEINDGRLDLLTIKKVPFILLIFYLLNFRRGPAQWMKGVTTHRTKSVEISTSIPLAVHRDGEHLGSHIRHVKLTVEKNALKIIVPKRYCI